jgi:hypothetical protein
MYLEDCNGPLIGGNCSKKARHTFSKVAELFFSVLGKSKSPNTPSTLFGSSLLPSKAETANVPFGDIGGG